MAGRKTRQSTRSSRGDVRALLGELSSLVRQFDANSAGRKKAVVESLVRTAIVRPADLIAYHDLLCFLVAYPDNNGVLALAEAELRGMSARVAHYRTTTRDRHARRLENSGLVDTTTTHPYSFELTQRLLRDHAVRIDIDREAAEKAIEQTLPEFLGTLVSWQECDALDYDEERYTSDWLEMARRSKGGGYLKTIVDLIDRAPIGHLVKRHFFDRLELETVWRLERSRASRTLQRVPCGRVFYQTGPFARRSEDLLGALRAPASALELQSPKRGEVYVHAINEVLAVRNRELFPLTLANTREVYKYRAGRGLTIFIFGMRPEDRLPIEANFGAMLVRNNLPIGYGVAAVLFDRVEIAINVFPAFRAGESAFTIEQFFRLFYHHFGSRVFLVRNTQMGYGEDEALYSGAFWFYYKLGFRALDAGVRALAEREVARQRADKAYRTPIGTMRRLSKSDVVLSVDGISAAEWKEVSIINLGYAVTRYFARRYDGDRRRGLAGTVELVRRALGIRSLSRWSSDELTALERMAPLVAMIPDINRWSATERSDLAGIVRAKGGACERRFVQRCNRHGRFREAVGRLASQSPD